MVKNIRFGNKDFIFQCQYSHTMLTPYEQKSLKKSFAMLAKAWPIFVKQYSDFQFLYGLHHTFDLEICGDYKIRRLNREFRNKDKVTDVLSFPVHQHWREMKRVASPLLHLGDIVICQSKIRRQAEAFKISYGAELLQLAIHGLLHLYGHDHEKNKLEEKNMQRQENRLLELSIQNN